MKKLLQSMYKGYILLEALVAISLLSIGVGLYQVSQLNILQESQRQIKEVEMVRILYEEVREQRYLETGSKQYQVRKKPVYTIVYHPRHVKITSEEGSWEIYRED